MDLILTAWKNEHTIVIRFIMKAEEIKIDRTKDECFQGSMHQCHKLMRWLGGVVGLLSSYLLVGGPGFGCYKNTIKACLSA